MPFAALWAAFRAAQPLIKVGIIGGILAALIIAFYGYRGYQRYLGAKAERDKQQIELTHQAQEATQQTILQGNIKQRAMDQLVQDNQILSDKLNQAYREIDRYEKSKQATAINADAVRIVNEFARVLNDATHERMPASSQATGEPALETEGPPTDVAGLKRIGELTDRLGDCEVKHRGLSEWALANYQAELDFYSKGPP